MHDETISIVDDRQRSYLKGLGQQEVVVQCPLLWSVLDTVVKEAQQSCRLGFETFKIDVWQHADISIWAPFRSLGADLWVVIRIFRKQDFFRKLIPIVSKISITPLVGIEVGVH
jgi:hypothetical protein